MSFLDRTRLKPLFANAFSPHSAPQNVATEEGVRRQETGDRILEENHSCRD
ncbi:MAG: hypothetical protein F6K18_11060 [Okeania sp. SIO2C2]|uniref:hypothetical protein n=1 Tax=Okeania sp. SIO2C2 TaxID=2607787 RepID=UPI0013B974BA|nr:hypothetical protein [Okeania sp. SIO2C2]NEP87319.1 hypothetical protein [Okeania sp. SIO2C2]